MSLLQSTLDAEQLVNQAVMHVLNAQLIALQTINQNNLVIGQAITLLTKRAAAPRVARPNQPAVTAVNME